MTSTAPLDRRALLVGLAALASPRCTPIARRRERASMNRTVTSVARAFRQPGHGFLVARLSESMFGPGGLDPFIAGDEFLMGGTPFPPHPHAGFSAVTWMFEDGEGDFTNRDTFSPRPVQIEPGALHWTAAGRGMLHEEVPTIRGRAAHGIQLFVDLPRALKQVPPQALHIARTEVVRAGVDGARVRVVVGAHGEHRSPLAPTSPVTLLDVALDRGARVVHRAPSDENTLVWVRRGAARVNGVDVTAHSVARLAPSADPADGVTIDGVDAHTQLAVLHGRLLKQPVLAQGPFVGGSQEELRGYIERYQRGEMGHLSPSFTR